MKKKFVYRKLEVDNKVYYQMYKIVNESEIKENDNNSEDLYREVDSNDETVLNDFLYTICEWNNGQLEFLKDVVLISQLHQMFYDKYQDFNIDIKNNFYVDKLNNIIKNDILFQEKPINELLNVIKSNLDIANSSIDEIKKRKLISNVIIYGSKGFGKSSTINTILKNSGVPSISMKLTTDPTKNITALVGYLGNASMGNMKYAENAIVFIEDNFDDIAMELEEHDDFETSPFYYLEDLLKNEYVKLGDNQDYIFDLSKITFVLVKNTSGKDKNTLYDEGLTESLMYKFKTVICFDKLSKEQIKEVLLNGEISILKTYQQLLNSVGKDLIIEDDFLDTLIDRIYYNVGGIGLINDKIELMIKTRWSNDVIVLNKEMVLEEIEDYSYLKPSIDDLEDKNDEDDDSLSNEAIRKYREQVKESKNKKDKENKNNEQDKKDFKLDLRTAKDEYKTILSSIMEYVKGQDEPLKNLLFHAFINDKVQNSNLDPDMKKERIDHMLIRGGAGTGKSFITTLIAKHLGNKPYAVIDCKRYTEAGYVGKSIDDMLIQLYYAAECDLKSAQNGILILDEIDKLSRNSDDRSSISRGGVQESLLKLMEGTIFDLEIKENGFTKTINFDTRSLMIICAGAFEGLDKIKEQRLKHGNKKMMGFQTQKEVKQEEFVDQNYTLADMQEFGIDAQLLRRINFHCDLNKLTKDDYKNIMLNSKSSAFLIKLERINMLGVEVVYDDSFVETFAEKVNELGFGVSGISILTDRIFSNFESKIMLENYGKVILNKDCVLDPSKIILEKNSKVLKKRK